jgi:hypothetical protein
MYDVIELTKSPGETPLNIGVHIVDPDFGDSIVLTHDQARELHALLTKMFYPAPSAVAPAPS